MFVLLTVYVFRGCYIAFRLLVVPLGCGFESSVANFCVCLGYVTLEPACV